MGASTRLALCGHSVPSHPGRRRRCCDECDPVASWPCVVEGCEREVRARGLCSSHYNQQHQPNRHRREKDCEWCGTSYVTTRADGRFCSLLCRDGWRAFDAGSNVCDIPVKNRAHQKWRDPASLLPAVRVPLRIREKPVFIRRWVAGRCVECKTPFIVDDYSGAASFCSYRCAKRVGRRRRRALRMGSIIERYTLAEIAERDGFRCGLCGNRVNMRLPVPHPKAATIDHVVPLSISRDDTRANVQLAHFLCNSIKGDRGGLEQLALIG